MYIKHWKYRTAEHNFKITNVSLKPKMATIAFFFNLYWYRNLEPDKLPEFFCPSSYHSSTRPEVFKWVFHIFAPNIHTLYIYILKFLPSIYNIYILEFSYAFLSKQPGIENRDEYMQNDPLGPEYDMAGGK